MKPSARKAIRDIVVYRFNLDEDKAKEEEIIESLKRNVEFRGTNLWTLIFAILIASIGLNVNSTAVIIGAMLISPLMGPIMGVGLGAGIFDFKLIKFSIKNLVVAVVISLLSSSLYFWLTPIHSAQSELLARTSPTLWDVLIAFFGGLAGIIASSRKNISNTIPGVAIATALMPPLCTAGYGIGTGNFYYFAGAFYLFLINSVFISISTFLIVRFLKFKPVHFINAATELKIRRVIWSIAVLTILPSAFLAYRFVQQAIFTENAGQFIKTEVESRNLFVINKVVDETERKISILIYGDDVNDSVLTHIETSKSKYGLGAAQVKLRSTINQNDISSVKANLDVSFKALSEKNSRIKKLEAQHSFSQIQDSLLFDEFKALFGEVAELACSKALLYNKAGAKETVYMLYVKPVNKMQNAGQIKNWLSARYKTEHVRILMDE